MSRLKLMFPSFPIAAFSIVMATGIISLVAEISGAYILARLLFILNNIIYLSCLVLSLCKFYANPYKIFFEMIHYQKGPNYLTVIAASCIIGIQYCHFTIFIYLSVILFYISILCYFVFITILFIGMMLSKKKPTLTIGIDGGWLLCTVSGCSLIILGENIHHFIHFNIISIIIFICLWSVSLMFYFIMITLIFFRFFFRPLNLSQFSFSYWINMGALAISALAGCNLITIIEQSPFEFISIFILIISFFLWLIAIWWGVFLTVFFIFKFLFSAKNPRYTLQNWSAVFPIGMLYVSTNVILKKIQLPISEYFNYSYATIVIVLLIIDFFQLSIYFIKKFFKKNFI